MDQANGIDGGDDRAFESGQVRFIDDQKVICMELQVMDMMFDALLNSKFLPMSTPPML